MRALSYWGSFGLLALCVAPLQAAFAASITTVQGVEIIIDGSATPAATSRSKRLPDSGNRPATNTRRAQQTEQIRVSETMLAGSQDLLQNAMALVGTPYVWGGSSPRGFDCSGLTWYLFKQLGIAIPRTADLQFAAGRPIVGDPLPGDLVFFQTYDYGASHVGVYLGGGHFVNSIGTDVHVTSFASGYFSDRYLGARRFLPG